MQQALVSSTQAGLPQPKQLVNRRSSKSVLSRPSLTPNLARGDRLVARIGGGNQPRKTLKREEEPEEYWSSKGEREGESPFKDPIAYIGLLAIFFPFVFLAVAASFGWVDLSGGR